MNLRLRISIRIQMESTKVIKKKVLEGIPPLEWGISEETTGIASMTRIMNYLGEDVEYTDLMGTSGAAFHIAFFMDKFCPSSPDMYDLDRSVSYLGYNVLTYDKEMENFELKSHSRIIESINNDIPVLAVDLVEVADWGIIVGYENDQLVVRTYYDNDHNYSHAQNIPWIVKFVTKISPAETCCESAIRSLRHAVDRFNKDIIYKYYANGANAYDVWIEKLSDETWFNETDEEELLHSWHSNAWIYNSLYDARIQARKYLLKIIDLFNEDETKYLQDAIELFRQITNQLFDHWHEVPFPSWVNYEKERIEFPFLYEPKWVEGTQWTQEMRNFQVNVLKKIKSLDIKAMKLIESFLNNVTDDCSIDC